MLKVERWGAGIQFPGDPVKRDWEWDINRLIGCDYLINSKPPGRRFNSREEAEAWIQEDKKTYPREKFSWQPESKACAWLRDRDGKLIPEEKIPRWLVDVGSKTKEQLRREME
jgi:hypothetical protein